MKKVPAVRRQAFAGELRRAHRLTSLGEEPCESSEYVFLLSLVYLGAAAEQGEEEVLNFALSPPAIKQLSEALML